MQTRIIIHRAYKGNELLTILVEVAGRLIGFPLLTLYPRKIMQERSAAKWASLPFITNPSLKEWKQGRKAKGATRFERVTLLGDTPIVAMRRIIRTPVWTKADYDAGKLPEVGAEIDGGIVVFVNSFNIVVELDSGAVIVSSPKTFLAVHKPIETDVERQQREREAKGATRFERVTLLGETR